MFVSASGIVSPHLYFESWVLAMWYSCHHDLIEFMPVVNYWSCWLWHDGFLCFWHGFLAVCELFIKHCADCRIAGLQWVLIHWHDEDYGSRDGGGGGEAPPNPQLVFLVFVYCCLR